MSRNKILIERLRLSIVKDAYTAKEKYIKNKEAYK